MNSAKCVAKFSLLVCVDGRDLFKHHHVFSIRLVCPSCWVNKIWGMVHCAIGVAVE